MIKQGLYLPEFEHENCGAGFICNLKGQKTNQIIHDALEILVKLEHRGGVSSDGKTLPFALKNNCDGATIGTGDEDQETAIVI